MTRRHHVLPNEGTLLVSTDLHGNLNDFTQLRNVFLQLRDSAPTHWVILGDLVHGPNAAAREREPLLYDYPDESFEIVTRVADLMEEFPDEVHLVLGNHDWAHVGGPATRKFYGDEAKALEDRLTAQERDRLKEVFQQALLCVQAPCGVFLSHGVPDFDYPLEKLNGIEFSDTTRSEEVRHVLVSTLTSYGQPEEATQAFLKRVSAPGLPQNFVIHGHDRDPEGYFSDGPTAFCPVIFGAPNPNKRYLLLDLASSYASSSSLRDGVEIRRLWEAEVP